MQPIKETAYNIAASAKSGMDKTKAVAQEKMEKMTANNPTEKELATEKREQRIHEAELNKQNMQQAAHPGGTFSNSTTGTATQSTGPRQMSALPGHGTGQPAGQVVEGTVQSHPIGTATGTVRSTTAQNTHAGTAGSGTGYGTGGYTG